jgi:hypothetical protein
MTATTRAGGTTRPSNYVSVAAVLPGGLCPCHGEKAAWIADPRYTAGGFYRCRAAERERDRHRYENMTGLQYNRKVLLHRRTQALRRIRERASEVAG